MTAQTPMPLSTPVRTEGATVRRAGGALGLLLARRARLKGASAATASPATAVPNTPDVWLAGLRLGG